MIHVVGGTDTYGRVKAVGKTAIVTTFRMVQMLPVEPLESYYVWEPITSETVGVPFLAHVQKVVVRGVPLARLDRTSVALAYVRAVFATAVLGGFIGTFTGLMVSLDRKPLDDVALTMTRFAEICLVTGAAGGLLTYLVPTVSRRERAIRTYCGEMLGVCIDPARVVPEAAAAIREALRQPDNPGQPGVGRPRSEYVRELILTRCDEATDAGYDCDNRWRGGRRGVPHLQTAARQRRARGGRLVGRGP
jgi:hypothetical protein